MLRLGPLADKEAKDLISLPLEELGIVLEDKAALIHRVFHHTGKLPLLIQYYCQSLVELTIDRNLSTISCALLNELEEEGEFRQYFLSPILQLHHPDIRALALGIIATFKTSFTTAQAAELAQALGHGGDLSSVRRTCDELVVQNILVWEHANYRVANQALRRFAHQAGLLTSRNT